MTQAMEALFTPGRIGTLAVKNRLAMPPLSTNYAAWTGEATDRQIRYYAERARGGVGLITVEYAYVHFSGKIAFYTLGIHNDAMVPKLKELVDAIHSEGAKASILIAHGGRRCRSEITGSQPFGPSPVPCLGGEVPRELTTTEIPTVLSWFEQAAARVGEAGFDAVTLHLTAGYLLESFLSPYSNQRRDEYGGSLENRMRLSLEVLERARSALGRDFPVLCRLCVDEFIDGGLTLDEAKRAAQMFERAGLDAIDTIAGIPESMHLLAPSMAVPKGYLVSHARAIKEVVSIPVFAVGRINDPLLAESILREGSADFIDMGRALVADPALPNKAAEGRFDDICPCIACNEGCHQRLYAQVDISCVTNPLVGREALFPETPASQPKKVLVAGGGPAGMMAALTAARRGHSVVLCEEGDRIGGQLLMGCLPPHKEEIRTLIDYLTHQVAKTGVQVRTQTAATEELVKETGAEVVIVATGARPAQLNIPSVDARIISAWDVLSGRETVGSRVVVIGGGEVGCELAELLATQGKEVTILELADDLATNMEPRGRKMLIGRLREAGVKALMKSAVSEVTGRTVLYEQGGLKNRIVEVDAVILAVGSAPHNVLGGALKRTGTTVHIIGDSVKPRRILEAIREGFELGYAL